MQTIVNSKQLYTTTDEAFEAAKAQIKAAVPSITSVYMTAWCGYGSATHFKLEAAINYTKKAEVEGTDLQEMVEEVVHRMLFQMRQDTLLLAPPTVEAAAQPIVGDKKLSDDEIPF